MKIRMSRTKERARKDLFSSESAAATIIAAVLLLSIIFTIFAVVRVAYVPEWKNDAEQLHMTEVQEDMTELKTMADTATFFRATTSNLPADYSSLNSPSTTVRIRMGGGEVPIVAPSRSSGTLSVNKDPYVAHLLTVSDSGNISSKTVECGGITYSSNNEQYVDQNLRYENGALILAQGDRSAMRQFPLFAINRTKEDLENETYNYSVSILIINITGTPESISSNIDTSLRFNASEFTQLNTDNESEPIESFSYTVFTHYPDAWYLYFNETAKNAGLYNDTDYNIESNRSSDPNKLSYVTFNFLHTDDKYLDNLYVNKSVISIESGTGTSSVSTSYVNARQPPIPGFHLDPSSGCAPVSIQIVDESQYAKNYSYNFGDETVVTEKEPNHTYNTSGTFNITQNVTNRYGTRTTKEQITIRHVPIANFTSDVTQGEVPLTVNFNDHSQYATGGVMWDFGDGSANETGSTVTHTYTSPRNYTVTLTASNGVEIRVKTAIIVAQQMPTAYFTASPISGYAPLTVLFRDRSENATKIYWEFGDGNNSTELNPTHLYLVPGNYTVKLTAINGDGQSTRTRTINIKTAPQKPIANFSSNVTSGNAPLTVAFTDKSTGSPTSWYWEFGDEESSTVQNPEHVYSTKGKYLVILTVSNEAGSNTTTEDYNIKVSIK